MTVRFLRKDMSFSKRVSIEKNQQFHEPFAKFAVEHDILLANVMCHS